MKKFNDLVKLDQDEIVMYTSLIFPFTISKVDEMLRKYNPEMTLFGGSWMFSSASLPSLFLGLANLG